MQRLLVINVVGLSQAMLAEAPHLRRLAESGFSRPMLTVLPAVTCSAQATMLTGLLPREHGVVGNGWYFRDTAEVRFWLQSNRLIQGERVYETAKRRNPEHTTAKMFWWYNMYAPVDCSVTPRPSYPADGRKLFDIYSDPPELRDDLQKQLGVFPLQNFWGPTAGIESSRWIADATLEVMRRRQPTLTLVYLPHLDYNLQRLGPDDPEIAADIQAVDEQAGRLIEFAEGENMEILVVSEYAITGVSRPVHLNRILREAGFLKVRRETLGWETLDAGASQAFAVADHQVAHIYVRDPADIPRVQQLVMGVDGVDLVLHREQQASFGIDHPRAGELVAIAAPEAWFTYYFWLDDNLAPDYARTVDIHRKPGYDPVELMLDPQLPLPYAWAGMRLIQKTLGFRYYMDVIGLDASVIKGSHGRFPPRERLEQEGPVLICSNRALERDDFAITDVYSTILKLQFGED